jgi:hypothetical protein
MPPDMAVYQGTRCSENVVESAMFMEPSCGEADPTSMPIPGTDFKFEFNQGKKHCGPIGGDLVSVTQAGWQGLEPGYEGLEFEF